MVLGFVKRQQSQGRFAFASQSEAELMRDLFEFMKMRRIFGWRMPIGPVLHQTGSQGRVKRVWKKSPLKGFPDIQGVLRHGRNAGTGRMFVVEAKSAKGEVTPEQVAWMVDLQAAGVACAVVRSVKDFERAMRDWGEID